MSLSTLHCLTLMLIFMTAGEAVEINLFDDFDISEDMQGIARTDGIPYEGQAFIFGDKKDDLLKPGELLVNEIAKQAKVYGTLTVSANIKIDPNQEGTLLWIETIYKSPVFGIWIKCERDNCKLTMLYSFRRRSYEKTFEDIGPLHDQEWHRLVVHIRGMKKRQDCFVSIYVDCAKQGEQAMLRDYVHLLPFIQRRVVSSQIRLAQRSHGSGFEKPWRGSLQGVKFVFNRDIAALIDQKRCSKFMKSEQPQNSPAVGEKETQQKLLPVEKTELIYNNDFVVLAGSMAGMRSIMSNQIEETKYLRRLIENFHFAERKQFSLCKLKPCYPNVGCTDTPEIYPGYKCGHCPIGLEGDGINCTDIDECTLNPCFPSVKCVNTATGYTCGSCPDGYRGGLIVGSGRKYAMEKQVCKDVDECAESNIMCAKFSECVNTMGSYMCGACADGYHGNPYIECKGISYCTDDPESNPCDKNALCIKKHHGRSYYCSCKVGYTGDGHKCALDSDMDSVPDYALACTGTRCTKDNCPHVPNPDQSDIDKDGRGDACDDDIDGDGILNYKDNCPKVANQDQKASDSDSHGDVCDNCPLHSNEDQADSDGTGMGDSCDLDMDNDGVINRKDNCPMNKNIDQNDVDGDGVGDRCDNCPEKKNPMQKDVDLDFIGDACDDDVDRDNDGIQDSSDNCPDDANASQLDSDSDRKGDECDRDDDNDGIIDEYDNCPLVYNPHQKYSISYGRGLECKHDFDGDGVKDRDDACPNDARISAADFRKHVIFEPNVATRSQAVWKVDLEGQEVRKETQSDSILIGNQAFESVEFNATVFVNTNTGDNTIGFVFGFQNLKSFYVATWKRPTENYMDEKPFQANAVQGLIIKEVRSSTGPSEALRDALWNSKSVKGQTQVLWKDPKLTPWNYLTSYKWILRLDTSLRTIKLNVFAGTKAIIATPNLYSGRFRGGRLGMFTFSQEKVVWTSLAVQCF